MALLFTIVWITLVIAGGIGLFLTWANYSVATLDWIEGTLTYGVFVILGLAVIVSMILMPTET